MPYVPGEKRLGLLYAVHEVFKQASKNADMVFDYEAWKEALQSLVPWTYRKQKEEDQTKIRKSVRTVRGALFADVVYGHHPGCGVFCSSDSTHRSHIFVQSSRAVRVLLKFIENLVLKGLAWISGGQMKQKRNASLFMV